MKLVVFVLRGCPVGWLGAYGNEWVATPGLDRFAAEGIVFDRHFSDCPDPHAARQGWLSQDLLARLRERHIFTAVVRANREENDGHPEFYVGWDKRFDSRPAPGDLVLPIVTEFSAILAELDEHSDWFLWMEIDALLPPWTVPPGIFEVYVEDLVEEAGDVQEEAILPWTEPKTGWFDTEDIASWELLHRSFAAVVTGLDADLGKLFELCEEAGASAIVTADFGFPLGEHGILGPHRPWLHEEFVHLPFMIRHADGSDAGLRVNEWTQPPDLLPTILGLFGAGMGGPPDRAEAITILNLDGATEWAIRTDEWACLLPVHQHAEDEEEPRLPKLFRKPDDRWEVNDLAAREPEVVEEFRAKLAAIQFVVPPSGGPG